MVDYVGDTRGNVCLPGVMMLGYIAAHSETLAMAVIVSKVGGCSLIPRPWQDLLLAVGNSCRVQVTNHCGGLGTRLKKVCKLGQ